MMVSPDFSKYAGSCMHILYTGSHDLKLLSHHAHQLDILIPNELEIPQEEGEEVDEDEVESKEETWNDLGMERFTSENSEAFAIRGTTGATEALFGGGVGGTGELPPSGILPS